MDRAAEEFADRCRKGESPSIAEYEARFPGEAGRVRRLLEAVAMMEQLRRGSRQARSLPERLGEFRVLRELGRGGMGVVYEAVQESLGRHVAVKAMHHLHLDPKRLQRFRREARAVAQLHHTNIVPIFGVGEHDGLPYYVRGQSDRRSDIFSLGLTLYELITLSTPHGELSPSELLRRVGEGSPTPPRRLVPTIPLDLETIVLKAIAPEPGHRYQSAAELAEDLGNFLEDRPIRARRATPIERALRWSRRNRAVAAWAAAAAASLLLAAVAGWVGFANVSRALERESKEKLVAEASYRGAIVEAGKFHDRWPAEIIPRLDRVAIRLTLVELLNAGDRTAEAKPLLDATVADLRAVDADDRGGPRGPMSDRVRELARLFDELKLSDRAGEMTRWAEEIESRPDDRGPRGHRPPEPGRGPDGPPPPSERP